LVTLLKRYYKLADDAPERITLNLQYQREAGRLLAPTTEALLKPDAASGKTPLEITMLKGHCSHIGKLFSLLIVNPNELEAYLPSLETKAGKGLPCFAMVEFFARHKIFSWTFWSHVVEASDESLVDTLEKNVRHVPHAPNIIVWLTAPKTTPQGTYFSWFGKHLIDRLAKIKASEEKHEEKPLTKRIEAALLAKAFNIGSGDLRNLFEAALVAERSDITEGLISTRLYASARSAATR
jgi:hypothetical protein